MGLFNRRSAPQQPPSTLALWLSGSGALPGGYRRLLDCPEVAACINRISAIVSSATIYLMVNKATGDERVQNRLSRFVDITPWPGFATRQSWVDWIVATLLGPGDGNALVLPRTRGGELDALIPMPDASLISDETSMSYSVVWRGESFSPAEVLHFRLHSDPRLPWKGRGFLVSAEALASSLAATDTLKTSLSDPSYKPPMIVLVDSDSDLSDDSRRDEFRKRYLEDMDTGKPWIIPAGLAKIEQIKPLSLADLAVKDTLELDKKAVASLFGVPPFLLGVGSYSEAEYNNFIRSVIIPICTGIEQELTAKLLTSEKMYFKFNRRRLYAYGLKEIVDIDLAMADRGYLNGDEVREDCDRDPVGLIERTRLENFIPVDMAGQQSKLIQEENTDA